MAYRDNVNLLCDVMGVENPVSADKLHLAKIYFLGRSYDPLKIIKVIEPTEMNKAGRLFIEFLYKHSQVRKVSFGDTEMLVFEVGILLKHLGRLHFAELWDDAEGKRALIEAFQKCWKIGVMYK